MSSRHRAREKRHFLLAWEISGLFRNPCALFNGVGTLVRRDGRLYGALRLRQSKFCRSEITRDARADVRLFFLAGNGIS